MEFKPDGGVIDAFWIGKPDICQAEKRILPDGCIDLIFQSQRRTSRLFVSALIEQAATVVNDPGTWFAGALSSGDVASSSRSESSGVPGSRD